MERLKKSAACRYWRNISFLDKVLIVFMIILLCELIFIMIDETQLTELEGRIEVVFRTSAASIFGYFLSSNFLNRSHEDNRKKEPAKKKEAAPQRLSIKEKTAINFQIVVAAFIGLVSIAVLIYIRNFDEPGNLANVASVSQFRDFFSASVGFLLGDVSNRNKETQ